MATIICPRFRPQMATVRPGVLKKGEYNEAKANAVVVEPVAFELSEADIKTKVLEVVKEAKELVDLTGAEVVVSVGRGISKDVETGIKLAEELAACSAALLAVPVLLSTPAGCLPTTRSVRPARPYIRSCTLLWAFPVLSSIRLVCRIPSAS